MEFEELRKHYAAGKMDPISEERSEGSLPPPPPTMRLPSSLSTEEENKAAIAKMFAHYDADGSGQISVGELVPLLQDLGVISAGDACVRGGHVGRGLA